jgi:hypothetical protein
MTRNHKDVASLSSKNRVIRFPFLQAHSLARTPVQLPDDARGQVTLIIIAFQRQAQGMVDSWLVPYTKKFEDSPGFTFYEIPMIKGKWWRLFSSSIDGGMRMGIPEKKHAHVITYYGDINPYLFALDIQDLSLAYAFLLDKRGFIIWRDKGFATAEKIKYMLNLAAQISS